MKVIKNQDYALNLLSGTHKVGNLTDVGFDELVAVLGEPTFNEESLDGKTQVEWVIELDEQVFTIYDWKTFDREFTTNQLTTWSIGGNIEPTELRLFIYKNLNEVWKERWFNALT